MNKKMIKILLPILIFIVLLIGVWFFCSYYLGIGPAFPFLVYNELESQEDYNADLIADDQLLALVDSSEEAEQIAALYEIILVYYQDGLAVYHTEEDPMDVIKRGEDNGYPTLSINAVREFN